MQQLGHLVQKWIEPVYKRRGFIDPQIISDWPRISSQEFAAFTRPNKIIFPRGKRLEGTLYLDVKPSHALLIDYARDMLLERINAYFGYHAVSKIRILQSNSF